MDANEFVQEFKANGSTSDWTDLAKVYDGYKNISSKLTKDRGSFSLNVLCIICRNLDKVPPWKLKIDHKILLHLTIDCVRETRGSQQTDRIKTLACIYHIHKHVVKHDGNLPPELVLKLSFMPFENDENNLLTDYSKTYWNIIADRLIYIETLKSTRPIIKLLAKLIEDILKVLHIYDTTQFCANILLFVIKKLHFLYSDRNPKEINAAFGKIFEKIMSKSDLKTLKSAEAVDLYVKLNSCLYVVVENTIKCDLNETVLDTAVRSCMVLLRQNPDLFHCLQIIYLNSFCALLSKKSNPVFLESILNGLYISCDTTEKLGYEKAMKLSYPFISQLLRVYLEYMVNNSESKRWSEHFTETVQDICLRLIDLLMKKLNTTTQIVKCEGCTLKSGLHDAIRLSFVKNFITISLKEKINLNKVLPSYYTVILNQHTILKELRKQGCVNHDKCYRKLQTDIHNVAISLYESKHYEFSIKLFDLFLKNEFEHFKDDTELKNISRALYNKSICELDGKRFEHALQNAFLSLIFALPDSLNSAKYMSFIMDIKAKALKSTNEEENTLQLVSILNACEKALQSNWYGNLRPFLKHLKFSELLGHEFELYSRWWPSIVPVAGVWKSLYRLCKGDNPDWVSVEPPDLLRGTLYEIILQTTSAVRSIHCQYYIEVIDWLLKDLEEKQSKNIELWMVEASLLSIKCEYNLAEAIVRNGWKTKGDVNPDRSCHCYLTLTQEHEALQPALTAVNIWTRILKNINSVRDTNLVRHSVKIALLLAHELIYCHLTTHGLQLAYVCVMMAKKLKDSNLNYQSLSLILPHASQHYEELSHAIQSRPTAGNKSVDTAIEYMANLALYYDRCGKKGLAASILQIAQGKLVENMKNNPDLRLDFAIGRVLYAQLQICADGQSLLTHINTMQRHYLSITNSETAFIHRRLATIHRGIHLFESTALAVSRLSSLRAWSRASASAAIVATSAVNSVVLCCASVCVDSGQFPQIKIDDCKYILGLQKTSEPQPSVKEPHVKQQLFTPKNNLETMLENMVFKRIQTSPSIRCDSVLGYRTPEFLNHLRDCDCSACMTPISAVLACKVARLESTVYFKAKEIDIARNYFNGTLSMFGLVDIKLKDTFDMFKAKFEDFVVDAARREVETEFLKVQVEILIEASLFELAQRNFEKSDDHVVRIYEMMQQSDLDVYLKNEIMNLMIVSAHLKNSTEQPIRSISDLELDMENLELTPTKVIDTPKTPENKATAPPKIDNKLVPDEEIPKLKLNKISVKLKFEDSQTPETKPTRPRSVFKIPEPIKIKPIPETIPTNTPKPKSVVKILLTQPSEELATPKTEEQQEFFTPIETPGEKFFTPLASVKTYSKKTLRHNIVKNLESEFSTPKAFEKENSAANAGVSKTRRTKLTDSKRYLKRATSPGKLPKEEKKPLTRPKRVQRSNINFSLDENN